MGINTASQTLGVELEMVMPRAHAAMLVQSVVGGYVQTHEGGWHTTYTVHAGDGRKWGIKYDSSIGAANTDSKCELVSPVLQGDADVALLCSVARTLQAHTAQASAALNCGMHVHVGMHGASGAQITSLVNCVYTYENALYKAVGVDPVRKTTWCLPMDYNLVATHNAKQPRTLNACANIWYAVVTDKHAGMQRNEHYHGTRYHGLNLHSLYGGGEHNHGTAEFRYFNGTVNPQAIQACAMLTLAMVGYAKTHVCKQRQIATPQTQAQAQATLASILTSMDADYTAIWQGMVA